MLIVSFPKELAMGQPESKITARHVYSVHTHGGGGPGFIHPAHLSEGEPGALACGSGDLAENALPSWESAWIDLGGEG
jgi:hypothetical protein